MSITRFDYRRWCKASYAREIIFFSTDVRCSPDVTLSKETTAEFKERMRQGGDNAQDSELTSCMSRTVLSNGPLHQSTFQSLLVVPSTGRSTRSKPSSAFRSSWHRSMRDSRDSILQTIRECILRPSRTHVTDLIAIFKRSKAYLALATLQQ